MYQVFKICNTTLSEHIIEILIKIGNMNSKNQTEYMHEEHYVSHFVLNRSVNFTGRLTEEAIVGLFLTVNYLFIFYTTLCQL